MDTLVYNEKTYVKTIETAVNVSIIGFLILCQGLLPIQAGSGKVAQLTAPDFDTALIKEKILNAHEVRRQNFEISIREKYPKAVIYDVSSGVKHIKLTKYYSGKPVRINVLEADMKLAKDLKLTAALSSDTTLKSRKSISSIAKNNNAIAAINGTYFKPQTGVPLGTLMINKKIYTGPVYDRVALGIFDNGSKFDVARVQLNAVVKGSGKTIKVDNINQPRMLSTYVLVYTPEWGKMSPYAPKYGMGLQVIDGLITKASANPIEIPPNGYVISGPKQVLQPLLEKKDVKLSISTNPEWKNVEHIISGGPYLVKDGEVYVDMTAQKLAAIGGRNPRSAVGYTKDNNLILVAVDGREGSSVGMTLVELAKFMKSIGCQNAINLDGGGSTVMYVNGQVVNNPQTKGGIPLSNAIVLAYEE